MRAAAATLPRPGELARALAEGIRDIQLPRARWLVALALLVVALAAAYLFWFRDSSFVRVERVTVTGLSGTDAPRERRGVVAAARAMTTLDYDPAALRRALGAGATVEAVHVTARFPHSLRIEVVEKAPVAVLVAASERVAVGSGGVLLPDVRPIPRDLPTIAVGAMPTTRLGQGRGLRLVAAAAAAPAALRARVAYLRELPGKGLVAFLHDGPQVILGAPTDLFVKWTTAAAILADPGSRGASYIDVRIPNRAVAGGLSVTPLPAADQPGAPPPVAAGAAAAATGATTAAPPSGASAATATPQQGASPTTTAGTAPPSSAGAQAAATGGTATPGHP